MKGYKIKNFDYIIIGSGSAGSALAYRLSEDGKNKIAVLENGGSDRSPLIQMPAALSYPMSMKQYDWGYISEPEKYLDGRRLHCPRGKVLGGSSSINGMVYVRGNPEDYDYWEETGANGWSFSDVLPYFKRMENAHIGEKEWRGKKGLLHITRGKRDNPLHDALMKSVHEAGYNATDDYNGYKQEGFGAGEMTVWKGTRWSSANAYLKPALKNKNLVVYKNVLVDHIIFSGLNAVGVKLYRNNRLETFRVNKEVICCAGSIGSPTILQRSGVGSAKLLLENNIEVIADRPGVGENLQDHLEIYFQLKASKPVSLYKHFNIFSKAFIGLQWLLFKNGIGATNHFETLGFIRSKAGISYPDIQFHFLPIAMNYDGSSPFKGHGFQLHVGPMRSNSRGWVKIKNRNPKMDPEIVFNYMSCKEDWDDFRNCVRLTREIINQPSLLKFINKEIRPGTEINSNDEIDNYIKQNVESAYHPCGTMRMGKKNNPMAVVDPECKVIGVNNVRIADSSIIPRITNGNINAPSIMIGEKAADHILGISPLPKSNDVPYKNKNWKHTQR